MITSESHADWNGWDREKANNDFFIARFLFTLNLLNPTFADSTLCVSQCLSINWLSLIPI